MNQVRAYNRCLDCGLGYEKLIMGVCADCDKKRALQTGDIDEMCEALQDFDGSFYTVCTHQQGVYWYCVLTFVLQDECDIVALGRGRTVEQSKRQCAINYRRSR